MASYSRARDITTSGFRPPFLILSTPLRIVTFTSPTTNRRNRPHYEQLWQYRMYFLFHAAILNLNVKEALGMVGIKTSKFTVENMRVIVGIFCLGGR